MISVHCPKHKHHGAKVAHLAAASAVCHFHRGADCRNDIINKLSIPGGTHTAYVLRVKDNRRLQKADTQATAEDKNHCQGLQLIHRQREEGLCELEGDL